MKVGIDGNRLRGAMSGIGRYLRGLLGPLDASMPEARFVVYTNAPLDIDLPSSRWSIREDRNILTCRLPSVLWTRFRLASLARGDRLDVFWAANTLVPSGLSSVPVVTTVYDLNHIVIPDSMSPINRGAHQRWLAADVRGANRVVAISQGTAERLQQMLGRSADAVVRPGIPLADMTMTAETAASMLAELGVRQPYVLAVGTREPRKNLAGALAAMIRLKAEPAFETYRLVLAGARGWGDDPLGRNSPEWVQPLDYVTDRQLVALYTGAEVFVFPSLYEGFGMPVSEARLFGCPVVASDLPELREAGGGDVVYVKPAPDHIAEGIRGALARPRPPALRPDHDWNTGAKTMATVLRSAAQRVPPA